MILAHETFLDKLIEKIHSLGIDLTDAKLDHIAYNASSSDEYDHLKPEFTNFADLIREPLVGGRRVGIFKFRKPLVYKKDLIQAIELIEPKPGQVCQSGLEHAEFLLPIPLEEFMKRYPEVDWNDKALNREEFPMLILKLSENMSVKFPRNSVLP